MAPYSDEKSASTLVEFSGFEGPEKRLEIDFCRVEDTEIGFRRYGVERWSKILEAAQCTIISVRHNEYFDAYLLSESSLFVYPFKIMIKTCGTTTPLEIMPEVLVLCEELKTHIEFFQYSRSDFLFPDKQPHPHNSWDNEVDYLRRYFSDGQSFVFGSLESARWHLFLADFTPETRPLEAEMDQTIELVFYDMKKDVLQKFWKDENFVDACETTKRSGIKRLLPRATIDDFVFDPCGYSMNGLEGPTYYTIHVTPEEECSFISFETNAKKSDYSAFLFDLLQTFKPGRFSVMLFADDGSNAGRSSRALQLHIPGYKLENMTTNIFCGNYNLTACNFVEVDIPCTNSIEPVLLQPMKFTMRMRALSLEDFERRKGLQEDVPSAIRSIMNEFDAEILPDRKTSMKNHIQWRISESSLEEPFYIVDLSVIVDRLKLWQNHFPRVRPYYAAKCNPDPAIIKLLSALGCGFDCASMSEISDVLSLGIPPASIIFANPCKMPSHIRYAKERDTRVTTFDTTAELHKIKRYFPQAQLVLRIATNDKDATCQLSNKYGAHTHEISGLLKTAQHLGLTMIGVSFHVGSGQPKLDPWMEAVRDARNAFDQMEGLGMKPWLLDIGGGFPGNDENSEVTLEQIAGAVNPLLESLFPSSVMVIAEPGRFFAEQCYTLVANVIGKKCVGEGPTRAVKYYVNDGIYGSFNCLMYDHAVVTPRPLKDDDLSLSTDMILESSLFGPTCDGLDCILKSVSMREMEVGEWLTFSNMGAYTRAATSRFNGFYPPQAFYVVTPPEEGEVREEGQNTVEITVSKEESDLAHGYGKLPSITADESQFVERLAAAVLE